MKTEAEKKAEELIEKFKDADLITGALPYDVAIQCSIIAVDEILASRPLKQPISWWNEVKQELTEML